MLYCFPIESVVSYDHISYKRDKVKTLAVLYQTRSVVINIKGRHEIEKVKVVGQGYRNREEQHIKTDLKLEELIDWFTHLQI